MGVQERSFISPEDMLLILQTLVPKGAEKLNKYDDDQPRDEHGRFSSDSSGELSAESQELQNTLGVAKLSEEQINKIADKIKEKINNLDEQNSTFVEATDRAQRQALEDQILFVAESMPPEYLEDKGVKMTRYALGATDLNTVVTLQTDGMGVAGAVNFTTYEARTVSVDEETNFVTPEHIHLEYLGTTGIIDGAGSALLGQVIQAAAEKNIPIGLEPLDDDAAEFWTSMGFSRNIETGSTMFLLKEDVQAIASRL